jgi:hypothetical protein
VSESEATLIAALAIITFIYLIFGCAALLGEAPM